MRDETRQTRLLKFRPRGPAPEGEPGADPELSALLAGWEAPAGPADPADSAARLLASYREAVAARPRPWTRVLTSRVGVPAPLAACFALALAASLLAHARVWGPAAGSPPSNAGAAAAVAPEPEPAATPEVRYVEVPVPGETRVVYVERRQPGAQARRAKGAVAGARPNSSAGDAASYFTPVDMADFKPADEVKIRVVRKGER